MIVWQKMMAWDLAGNYSYELLRHDIVGRVGAAGLADLMPPYPAEGPSILGAQWAGGTGGAGRPGEAGGAGAAEQPQMHFCRSKA